MSTDSDSHGDRGVDADNRKSVITAAALRVIVKDGVHRTTHRRIAAEAGVPLGSLTYYFGSLDEILEAAFRLLSGRMASHYRTVLEEATTRDAAIEAVIDLIVETSYASTDDIVALIEMYSYAAYNPTVRALCSDWLRTSRANLGLHFAPDTARALDALIEGWPLQRSFDTEPVSRHVVSVSVRALVDATELRAESEPTLGDSVVGRAGLEPATDGL